MFNFTTCLWGVALLGVPLSCVVPAVGNALPAPDRIPWHATHEEALKASKEDGRPVFILFTGSDWCYWCMKLEREILEQDSYMQEGGSRFHHVYIDSPRRTRLAAEEETRNADLRKKYDIQGYPTILILDSEGGILAEHGYTQGGVKPFFQALDSALAGEDDDFDDDEEESAD